MMNWFRKHRACVVCGVHYDPPKHGPHAEYCPTHREPLIKADRERAELYDWVERNQMKIRELMREDERARAEAFQKLHQAAMNAAGQASAQMANTFSNQQSCINGWWQR